MSLVKALREQYPHYADYSDEQIIGALAPSVPTTAAATTQETAVDDRSFGSDLVAAWGIGSNQLLKGVGSIYGLMTGDMDNAAVRQGERGIKYYQNQWQSDDIKARQATRQQAIQQADGEMAKFGATVWETISDPALLATTLVEQGPMLVAGAGAGRVVGAASSLAGAGARTAGKLAGVASIGSMAGLQGGSIGEQAYTDMLRMPDEIWQQNPEFNQLSELVGPERAKEEIALRHSRAAATAAAGLSLASQRLIPGGSTLERSAAGEAVAGFKGGVLSRAAKGFAAEGTQEIVEEGGGQLIGNTAKAQVDLDQNLLEGVGEASGMALAAGGPFGAIGGMANPRRVIDEANARIDDAGNQVAATGGDALSQESAKAQAASSEVPNAVSQVKAATREAGPQNLPAPFVFEGDVLTDYEPNWQPGHTESKVYSPATSEPAQLPPGTGQIDMGRELPERTFAPTPAEYEGVGRSTVERAAQAKTNALPAGNATRAITPDQYRQIMERARLAMRTPVPRRTTEMKQALEVREQVRVGQVEVTDIQPAQAASSPELRMRANGSPFATERAAQASAVFRDNRDYASVVPVDGGFAAQIGGTNPVVSQEAGIGDAQAAPVEASDQALEEQPTFRIEPAETSVRVFGDPQLIRQKLREGRFPFKGAEIEGGLSFGKKMESRIREVLGGAVHDEQVTEPTDDVPRFSRRDEDNTIDPEYTPGKANPFWEGLNNGALRRGSGNSRQAEKAWVEENLTAGQGLDRGRPQIIARRTGGGLETILFERGIAGFQRIVTEGQVTQDESGKGVFTLRVVPSDLIQGGINNDTSILTVSLRGVGNDEYEVGVFGPVEGGAAAQALAGTEYLSDTGTTNQQGLKYLKLNIGNAATKSFLSEAVRRLAMHNGRAPDAVLYSARDTGARAGDKTVRKFDRSIIESKFSRTAEEDAARSELVDLTAAGSSIPLEDVERIAGRIVSSWKNAPDWSVVATDFDLPADLQESIDKQNARGKIDGVFHGGRFYLVAEHIRNELDVERIIFHEALGHYGLRQLYGPALNLHLDGLWKRVGGLDGLNRLQKKYNINLAPDWQSAESWPVEERRQMIMDELVAYLAGGGHFEPTLIQRIAHLVRKGLRKIMAGTRFAERLDRMTGVELLRIVAAARNAVVEGEARVTTLTHDPRFVRMFEEAMYGSRMPDAVPVVRGEGLKSVVTADSQPSKGMSVVDAERLARAFMDAYNGNIPLKFKVADTQEDLYGPEATIEKHGVIKGAYLPADGVFTLAARNLSEMGDAIETIRHEVLGHYGLNTFTPADKRRILDQLIEARDSEGPLADTWAEIDELYADKSDDVRAEEVFAKVVELEPAKVGKLKAFVDRLLFTLNGALRRAGIIKAPLKLNDVRRMARYVAEGIRAGRRQQQTFPESNDALFRRGGSQSEPDAFAAPEETHLKVALRKMADKFQVLKDLQKNIQSTGGSVNESNDTYLAEELFHGKTEEDLRQMRETFIKPLADKMAKFGIEQKDLDQYLYAKHAPERNAHIAEINPELQEAGSGMSDAKAAEVIRTVRDTGKLEQYEQLAGMVYDMLETRRETMRSAGLEQDGMIDAWENKYEFYVPLKGWAVDEQQDSMARTGKGFNIAGKESKRAMGRSSEAASPSSYAIQDLTETLIRRRKNEVGNALLKLAEDNPNKAYWQVFTNDNPDIDHQIFRSETEASKQVRTAAKKAGQPEPDRQYQETVRETPIPMAMMSDKYFQTKRKGRVYFIKLEDERLMKAMKNIGPDTSNFLIRNLGTVNRVLSSLNTSYNPEFVVGNFARDVQTAVLNLMAEQSRDDGKVLGEKIAKQTVKDIPKAMKAVYRGLRNKDEAAGGEWQKWFTEFREAGAKTGWFDMKDIDGQAADLQSLISMAKGGVKGNAMKWFKATGQMVEDLNGSVENAVRLSAYVNARKAGISQAKAASLAKNMTVNFNRRGEVGTTLNALYMFANASIQGSMNFARTMIGLKGPKGDPVWQRLNTAQKVAAGLVMGSFAIAMVNRAGAGEDDDGENWYDKVPDYVKERNLVIMKSLLGGDQDGSYWSIPLPYGYNIFHVFGNTLEGTTNGNTSIGKAATDLTLATLGSFSPIGFQESQTLSGTIARNITPTLGKPIADIVANENFMGTSIYNENFPFGTPRPDSQLGRRSTPEGYKAIAEFLNEVSGGSQWRSGYIDINPDVMRYMANYFTGAAGKFVFDKAPNNLYHLATLTPIEARETLFVSRVSGRVLPYEDREKFYSRRDEINQTEAEWKGLTGGDRMRFYRENRRLIALRPLIKSSEKQLKALRQQRDRIYALDLPRKQQEARMEVIEARMKRVIDRFNREYAKATGGD